MKIEIGGGRLLTRGYVNLDPEHGKGPWRRRAQDVPWPCEDGGAAAVKASHVMEHIPAGMDDRVLVMNEAWRVLAPGGRFEIIVPCVMVNNEPVRGWWPWADPTHVSFWCYPESWLYFCEGPFKPNADYGIREWKFDPSSEVRGGWEAHVVLIKP